MAPPYARSAALAVVALLLLAPPPALAQAVPDVTVTPSSFDLGDLSVPGGANVDVEVRNDGVGDLVITDASVTDLTGDDAFSPLYETDGFNSEGDLDLPYTLAPGEAVLFGLTVSPRVGRQNGSVTFETNDPDEPTVVVPITFFGTQVRFGPAIPARIDFGTVSVAANASGAVTEAPTVCREVRVPTEGDEPSQAFASAVDDDQFSVPADTDPTGLDPFAVAGIGDTLAFDVCYTPDTVGPASATLEFSAGSTLNVDAVFRTVALTGTATTTNLPPVPQGIADGDVVEVETGGPAATLAFSFRSPEPGQTTTITLTDVADVDSDADRFPGPARFNTTPGNPATAEATFAYAGADAVQESGDFDFVVEACDDGPDGGACTELRITVRVNPAPVVACEPGVALRMESLAADYVSLYLAQASPLDDTGCSLVTFDGRTERVVASVPLQTAAPYNDFVFAESGSNTAPGGGDAFLPAGAVPDEFGAVAVVRGTPAVGDGVRSVFGNVVSAVVYRAPDDVVGAVPDSPLSPPTARVAGGADDLATLLAGLGGAVEARSLSVGPNPTRAGAAATFALGAAAAVRVAVYDVLGREVAVLADGVLGAGEHRLALDASALPAGAYVVRLVAGGAAQTARLTVAR